MDYDDGLDVPVKAEAGGIFNFFEEEE